MPGGPEAEPAPGGRERVRGRGRARGRARARGRGRARAAYPDGCGKVQIPEWESFKGLPQSLGSATGYTGFKSQLCHLSHQNACDPFPVPGLLGWACWPWDHPVGTRCGGLHCEMCDWLRGRREGWWAKEQGLGPMGVVLSWGGSLGRAVSTSPAEAPDCAPRCPVEPRGAQLYGRCRTHPLGVRALDSLS